MDITTDNVIEKRSEITVVNMINPPGRINTKFGGFFYLALEFLIVLWTIVLYIGQLMPGAG